MGINVLSLFDGMSCGQLALNKAGIDVDNYVASEVKLFAIKHTRAKFPNTIEAGDVTKLHYENGKLYRDCKRWCIGDPSVLSRDDLENNKDHIKTTTICGQDFLLINVVDLIFANDFDKNNKILADYKDNGLVLNASTLSEDDLNVHRDLGFVDLPNGELAIWEVDENNMIFEGNFDILIGGSPCQNFSLASSTNDEKYGLEGPKSRLFFDYIRLRSETKPKYYFLENVRMQKDSKEMLDSFLGHEGIFINSEDFSIQHRPRIYWTNLPALGGAAIRSDRTEDEINFQNFKLKTLPRLEWALYVKKFPGSYFGYSSNAIETIKGGFEFVESENDNPKQLVNKRTGVVEATEGTKAQIREIVNFDEDNNPDVSFTNEEAHEIAMMNEWAREEVEAYIGTSISDREFVEFIHNQMLEAMVKKSPSRDNMRYGKTVIDENGNEKPFSHCHNITDSSRIQCLTRKQDRFPNSGLISFGPYCRFVTKLEICKGQTVPYEFLGDLTYSEIQDVCGDGWTVDVVTKFFELIGEDAVAPYVEPIVVAPTIENTSTTTIEEPCVLSEECFENTVVEEVSTQDEVDIFDEEIDENIEDESFINDDNENSKTIVLDENIVEALKNVEEDKEEPSEDIASDNNDLDNEDDELPTTISHPKREKKSLPIPKGKVDAALVFETIKKYCDEKTYSKILYEVVGWKYLKKMDKEDVAEEVIENVIGDIRKAISNQKLKDKEVSEKFEWYTS